MTSAGPVRGWARLLRVAALGTSSLLLAGVAHVAGGGHLPGLGLGLLLIAVTGALAVVLTARRCRLPLLLLVLGVEQIVLHTLFEASRPMDCAAAAIMPAVHEPAMLCRPVAAVATGDHSLSLVMLVAHVLATAVTAWLLSRGEAALWRLADSVVRAALPRTTPWPAAPPQAPALSPLRTLVALVHRDDAPPRGPPAIGLALG
jgi:hypothetical protein